MDVAVISRSTTTDRVVLEVRLRSRLGEDRVRVDVPRALAIPDDDADFTVPMSLLPAMVAGEDLHVNGAVTPRLLRGAGVAASVFATWDPTLHRARVSAADAAAPRRSAHAPARSTAVFLSRGVDSLYELVLERPAPVVTRAVHVDGIEPRHGSAVRTAEIDLARETATRAGVDFSVVHTDVRDLTDGRRDWADANGGALAAIGLALGGGVSRMIIPSSNSIASLVPYGSHPALDGRFSTDATTIEYGEVRVGRLGKVVALARDRPDLLPYLKVCYHEDRPDNCGRCGKCLNTMCCLRAVDALHLATGFPASIDLDALRATRATTIQSRLHWLAVARGLPDRGLDGALRAAILDSLHRSARPGVVERGRLVIDRLRQRRGSRHASWCDPSDGFDFRFSTEVWATLTSGRPARPLAPTAELPDAPPLRAPDA